MSTNKILIILGEPNSKFSEVLFKYFRSKFFKHNKNKIILIGNKKLFQKQMIKLKYNFKIKEISSLKKYTANSYQKYEFLIENVIKDKKFRDKIIKSQINLLNKLTHEDKFFNDVNDLIFKKIK